MSINKICICFWMNYFVIFININIILYNSDNAIYILLLCDDALPI